MSEKKTKIKKFQIHKMKDSGEKHYTAIANLFDLSFRVLIVGKSQLSGKTNIVGNLLLKEEYYKGKFDSEDIYIVSPSTKVDKKIQLIIKQLDIPEENVFTTYDEEVLEVLYDVLEDDYKEQTENNKHGVAMLAQMFADGKGYELVKNTKIIHTASTRYYFRRNL